MWGIKRGSLHWPSNATKKALFSNHGLICTFKMVVLQQVAFSDDGVPTEINPELSSVFSGSNPDTRVGPMQITLETPNIRTFTSFFVLPRQTKYLTGMVQVYNLCCESFSYSSPMGCHTLYSRQFFRTRRIFSNEYVPNYVLDTYLPR